MSNYYQVIVGFDTTKLNLKFTGYSHYAIKAIVTMNTDLEFESNLAFLKNSITTGVIDVEFELLEPKYVFILEVDYYQEYDSEYAIQKTEYYSNSTEIDLSNEEQNIVFGDEKPIFCELITRVKPIEGYIHLPLIETNLNNFELPKSKYYISNFMSVEIQTQSLKAIKYINGETADLSQLLIPYCDYFLIKLIFNVKLFESIQQVDILNAKVYVQKTMQNGVFFKIENIDPKVDISFFALVDSIIDTIKRKQDNWQDETGASVRLSSILNPGFINRWSLMKNPKLVEVNSEKFMHPPYIVETENKKLNKELQYEYVACDDITSKCIGSYTGCVISGSLMIYLEVGFLPRQTSPFLQYKELLEKSQSVALLSVESKEVEPYFLICNTKEINHKSLCQSFEVGSGNLAICKLSESTDYLKVFSSGNVDHAALKILSSNTKTLASSTSKSINLTFLYYLVGEQHGFSSLTISSALIREKLNEKEFYIDKQLTESITARLYIWDQKYCDEKALDFLPEEAAVAVEEQPCIQSNESQASLIQQSLRSAQCFFQPGRQVNEQAVINYYESKSDEFFFVQPRQALSTYQDALLAEEQKILRQMREIEEAKRQAELVREELQKEQEEEERQRQQQAISNESSVFLDRKKRLLDEEKLKAERQRLEEQEREKEEFRRKMQLKKERNLKWQQQIQRFIVRGNGQVSTFYNDKLDKIEREAVKQEKPLLQIQVRTKIIPVKQPQISFQIEQKSRSIITRKVGYREKCLKELKAQQLLQREQKQRHQSLNLLMEAGSLYEGRAVETGYLCNSVLQSPLNRKGKSQQTNRKQ